MISSLGQDLRAGLTRRLREARRIAIVGIGDELLPVDQLGMYVASEIDKLHLPRIRVFFTGIVPESFTGPLRKYHPDHVLFLDSADMGALPGTMAIVKPGKIKASLFSTHILPLSVVMEFVAKDAGVKVTLLGIQPDTAHPDWRGSPEGQKSLQRNLSVLVEVLQDTA
jgi:hydrogenase 3 maturation protease